MKKTRPCPTCKKPASWDENPFRPFCSERCKLLDLGRWLNEDYRVEAEPDETDMEQIIDLLENPPDGRETMH